MGGAATLDALRERGYRASLDGFELVVRGPGPVPEDLRRDLVKSVIRAFFEAGIDPREELALFERVVLGCVAKVLQDAEARLKEFVTPEAMARYIEEEAARLSGRFPDGIPEPVLATTILTRTQREHPEAFEAPKKRKGGGRADRG